MAEQVKVRSVMQAEKYGLSLGKDIEELEKIYLKLVKDCEAEKGNWDDPQFTALSENITKYYAVAKQDIEKLKDSKNYILKYTASLKQLP